MEEYILQLFKEAIKYEIGITEFWDLTLYEIEIILEAKREEKEAEAKEKILYNYNLASIITTQISCILAGKKPPSLYEAYPDLFVEEEKNNEENKPQFWEIYKEQMLDFANRHNRKRGENKDK